MPRIGIKPNFFIVGAPKCGTTAMDWYLSQHPHVFMARVKEMHYFGRDLHKKRECIPDEKTYLAQFSPANRVAVIGESSVHYLVSEYASEEIYEFNPSAKILIMIRNPIDQIISNYHQMRFSIQEDQISLHDALELEDIRRQERALPPNLLMTESILYRHIASYSKQIERYFSVFGREACLVLFTEELAQDPLRVYKKVELFLGVPHFTPDFSRRNVAKAARWHFVNQFLYHPPKPIRKLVSSVLPMGTRHKIARYLATSLSRGPDEALMRDKYLRQRLAQEFEPEVARLEALLGRALGPLWHDFATPQRDGSQSIDPANS